MEDLIVKKMKPFIVFVLIYSCLLSCKVTERQLARKYDLSSPSQSLYSLSEALIAKDTVALKYVTFDYGFQTILKEIGYNRMNVYGRSFKNAYKDNRVDEFMNDSSMATVSVYMVSDIDTSRKELMKMTFGKENAKWKFGGIQRDE
jgi:hypothetical protein